MSSLVINGDTSGSITLAAPAVAGSPVLTLPTVTGTILSTTSPKTGNVLQVVQANYTTQTSTTSGSFQPSGLTATITPSSASNKIMVFVSGGDVATSTASTGVAHAIYRGTSTQLNQYSNQGPVYTGNAGNTWIGTGPSANYLDSPATTSAVTYNVYFKPQSGGATATVQRDGTTASMTLMEIAA